MRYLGILSFMRVSDFCCSWLVILGTCQMDASRCLLRFSETTRTKRGPSIIYLKELNYLLTGSQSRKSKFRRMWQIQNAETSRQFLLWFTATGRTKLHRLDCNKNSNSSACVRKHSSIVTSQSISNLNKPGPAQIGAPLKLKKNKFLKCARDTIVEILSISQCQQIPKRHRRHIAIFRLFNFL